MDFRKLNEELETFIINELSDKTKQAYLAGRQAQLDKAQKAMEKARAQVKKSDARQIATLPQGIDKETATDALQDLKSEMRRIDSGSDWRLEEQDNEMCLSVRYWGSWHGDDGSGDYDWQTLDDQYRDKLDGILTKVQKKYGVQIYEPGSEKNWLDFCIPITKKNKDSMFSYEDEKAWKEFLDKVRGTDITGPIQKKRGKLVAKLRMFTGSGYSTVDAVNPDYGDYQLHVKPVENGPYEAYILGAMNKRLDFNPWGSFQDCLQKAVEYYNKKNGERVDRWISNQQKYWAKRKSQAIKQGEDICSKLFGFEWDLMYCGKDYIRMSLESDKSSYMLYTWERTWNWKQKYELNIEQYNKEGKRETKTVLETNDLQEVINYLNKDYSKQNSGVEYQKFSEIKNGFSRGSKNDYEDFFKFIKNSEWDFPFVKEDIELLVKSKVRTTLYLFYLKPDKSYGLAAKDNKYGDGFMEFGQKSFAQTIKKIDSWWNKGIASEDARFLAEYPDFKFLINK